MRLQFYHLQMRLQNWHPQLPFVPLHRKEMDNQPKGQKRVAAETNLSGENLDKSQAD